MSTAVVVHHLRPSELAERWGTSEKTLANERALRKGPPFLKFGALVRYRLEDVEAYEAKHLVPPVS